MLDLRDVSIKSIKKSIEYWQRFWDKRGDRYRELMHELSEIEREQQEAKSVLNYLGSELKRKLSQTKEV